MSFPKIHTHLKLNHSNSRYIPKPSPSTLIQRHDSLLLLLPVSQYMAASAPFFQSQKPWNCTLLHLFLLYPTFSMYTECFIVRANISHLTTTLPLSLPHWYNHPDLSPEQHSFLMCLPASALLALATIHHNTLTVIENIS